MINVICLLIIIGILLVMLLEKWEGRLGGNIDVGSGSPSLNYKKGFYFLVIYGLIAVRCIGLGSIPGGFNQDGAMGAVDALALSQYGTDRFGTWLPAHFKAWSYGQMSVLLSYFTVPFIKLWGLSSLTARLPMCIASLLGAGAVYRIVKEMYSRNAALIALIFLAINPWHFMQSRWALDCNLFPHMFVIGLYLLYKGIERHKYLYFSMVFFALCMYCYGVAFYMVPFFLLITCIILLVEKQVKIKSVLICAAIYFSCSFSIYGTMLINFMGWETVRLPFVTMPYFEGSVRANDIVFFSEEPLKQLAVNFRALINVVFLQKPDLIWNAIDDFGTMYLCSMPLILLGVGITIYQLIKSEDSHRRHGCILLLTYWGCSIFTGLCINSVNVNRINIIFYSHIIFAGIAIYYIVRSWRKMAFLFIGVYGLLSILFFNHYFTTWAQQMEDVFYSDFLEAVQYAGELECDYYYITPDTQYEGSANVSEILTMFAQQIDARYYQGQTNRFMGNEISFLDRYKFRNPSPEEINTRQYTAYVVKTDKISQFNEEEFWIKRFDSYSVAVPRQYVTW
ncbi:MAG: glycosyltransferase family 39 protein [Bacillota bacterium]|nr:glycosyltransferase family 39 protein [Bacillota bacterium]